LFGHYDAGVPWIGYGMALSAGFTSGGTFIAARKAHDINPSIMTTFVMIMEAPLCFILPLCGIAKELPIDIVLLVPYKAAVGMVFFLVISVSASGAMTLGSQLCPAAASSTIFASTSMGLSYVLQTVLYQKAPQLLTIIGAGLMLCGVALMALARYLYNPIPASCNKANDLALEHPEPTISADQSCDDDEVSLASFVASEWSGLSPKAPRLRQRPGIGNGNTPVAQSVGFAGA
jgi:drug/metabolite transporter (DMT)-like permease